MCGRYTLSAGEAEVIERFNVEDVFMETRLTPRFNIAPTQLVPVITQADGKRILSQYQWGLVPFWVKDLKASRPMINARSETLSEKPFFKTALSRRRCLIPADGFFEWQAPPPGQTKKQPLWIHLKNEGDPEAGTLHPDLFPAANKPKLFAFAGLFDCWKGGETPLYTCTIITTSANEAIAPVHERMPVILSPDGERDWLDESNNDPADLLKLLIPAPDNLIQMFPVSTKVNSAKAQGEDLILPLQASPAPEIKD